MNKPNFNKKKSLFFALVYTVGAISFSSFDSCGSGESRKVDLVAPKKGDTSPDEDNPLVNRLTEDVNVLKNQIKDQNQVISDLKSKVGDNTIQGLAKDIDSIINLQKPDSLINETKNNTTAITSMQDDKVPGSLANKITKNAKNIAQHTNDIAAMKNPGFNGSLANLIDNNAKDIVSNTKGIVDMQDDKKQGSLAESIANIKIILKAILVNAGPNGDNIAFVNKYEVAKGLAFPNGVSAAAAAAAAGAPAAPAAPATVPGNAVDIQLILDTIGNL